MDETNAYGITPTKTTAVDNETFKVAVKVKPNNSNNMTKSATTAPAMPDDLKMPEMPDMTDMPSKVDTASTNPTFHLSDLAVNAPTPASDTGNSLTIDEPITPAITVVPDAQTPAPLTALAVSPEPVSSGAPISEPPPAATKTMQPKKSKKMMMIILVIILVAILAGAAYYFFIIRKPAAKTVNGSTTTTSSTIPKLTASDVAATAASIDKDLAIQNGNNDISGTDLSDAALGL